MKFSRMCLIFLHFIYFGGKCMHARYNVIDGRQLAGVGSLPVSDGSWGIELGLSGLATGRVMHWAILLAPIIPYCVRRFIIIIFWQQSETCLIENPSVTISIFCPSLIQFLWLLERLLSIVLTHFLFFMTFNCDDFISSFTSFLITTSFLSSLLVLYCFFLWRLAHFLWTLSNRDQVATFQGGNCLPCPI